MNQHSTSTFGRGWIPMERDIGLPDDVDPFAHRRAGGGRVRRDGAPLTECIREEDAYHSSPLPPAGGAGGGRVDERTAYPEHTLPPPPSRMRDGLSMSLPFTVPRRVRFLHMLATTGNVRRACAMVGVSAQSAYVHKRRDAAFAHGWDAALLLARDAAEEVLAERALHGVSETIFYRGEAVGSRTRHDARLLLAHLARLDRHAERTEAGRVAAPGIAARFDDYLAELLDTAETGWDPLFEPPLDDLDGPAQWTPVHPAREDALRAAREDVLYSFPKDVDALPPEALADLDPEGLKPGEVHAAALAQAQDAATTAAAETWDEAAAARLAALDAFFAAEDDADEPDLPDPLHFHEVQMGRGTARAAGGGGAMAPTAPSDPALSDPAPSEPPIETKALFPLRTVSTLSTSPRPRPSLRRPPAPSGALRRLGAGGEAAII